MSDFANEDLLVPHSDFAVAAKIFPGISPFGKFGATFNPSANTDGTVWPWDDIHGQELYPWIADGVTHTLFAVSDSIEDDLGLTGAEYLYVEGVDALGAKQRCIVELDGTTPVELPGVWFRTDRAAIGECGSTDGNVGNITIYHTANVAANVVNGIPAVFDSMAENAGQSLNTFYTVRKGEMIYIDYIDFTSLSSQSGVIGIRIRAPKIVGGERSPLTREGWRLVVPKAEAFGDQQMTGGQGITFGEYTDIEMIIRLGTSAKASGFISGRRAQVSPEVQNAIAASLGTTPGLIV